jgi:integrase
MVSVSGRLIAKGPKSEASQREVPIPVLAAILEAHCEEFGVRPTDLVFTSPKGGSLRYGNLLRRVPHPVSEEVLGITLGTHDLRRTFGAHCRAAGIDFRVSRSGSVIRLDR